MKKLCALIAAAILVLSSACAMAESGAFAVSDMDYAMLFSGEGEPLTSPRDYFSLYCLSDANCPANRRLFSAMAARMEALPSNGDGEEDELSPCALMNAKGELLTEFAYDYFTHFWREGVVIFSRDGLDGAMDEEGRVILEAKYGALVPAGDGAFFGTPESGFRYDQDGYAQRAELCRIEADGGEIQLQITTSPYALSGFSEGLMALPVWEGDEQRYGYIDSRGEIAIEPQFDWAENFSCGLAQAQTPNGLCGVLALNGTWALEPRFAQIVSRYRPEGFFAAETFLALTEDNAMEVIDRESLKTIKTFRSPGAEYFFGNAVNNAVYTLSDGGHTAVCDLRGKVLLSFAEDEGVSVDGYYAREEGMPARLIWREGDWPNCECYLILPDGTRVAGPYQELNCLSWENGEGRYGVSTYKLLEERAQDGGTYWTSVWDSYRYGLIDQDGNEILPTRYRSLQECAPGLYWAREADFAGLIDEEGNWLYTISDYEELLD